jgi:peptidoglycan/LPS O-acetylase OafA/YrhL
LTHVAVQILLDWTGRALPEPVKHLVGLVFVAAVLLLSVLAHLHVEVPWRERGKRIAARLEAGAGAPATVGAPAPQERAT